MRTDVVVLYARKLQLLAAWLVRNKRMNNSYQCPQLEKSEEMAARKSK